MELTSHEQKILDIVNNHPEILDDPEKRTQIAELYGLSEKTLRNRIAELKKYGVLTNDKKTNGPYNKAIITDDNEVDLLAIWELIKSQKWFITKISIFFTMLGLIYSLMATVYYDSSISMYPAGDISQTNDGLGEFSGLAKSFGIGGFGSAPTYNIPDIINSRTLKQDIILKKWKTAKFPQGTNLIAFWELDKTKLFSPKKWLMNFFPPGRFAANPEELLVYEAKLKLEKLISVKEELSGLIRISVLMQDPNLASNIANYIAKFVKEFISYEQQMEATRNREFIENQKLDAKNELENSEELLTDFRNNHPTNLDSPRLKMIRSRLGSTIEENRAVYITLRQQFEIAKIEEVKDNLLINILDNAEPAVLKAKPKRKIIVLLSIFLGGISGIAIILIRYSVNSQKGV
jgi:capsular polysaccharide biosynthesis protein